MISAWWLLPAFMFGGFVAVIVLLAFAIRRSNRTDKIERAIREGR